MLPLPVLDGGICSKTPFVVNNLRLKILAKHMHSKSSQPF